MATSITPVDIDHEAVTTSLLQVLQSEDQLMTRDWWFCVSGCMLCRIQRSLSHLVIR